jgi:uncharacterized membrane protein YoaK (UPF0700 family)
MIGSAHLVMRDEHPNADTPMPSLENSLGTKLLPFLLGMIAGSVDVIGFLGLGLFTAHITGNLVILAAHIVARSEASPALMISVPVFIIVLAVTSLFAGALDRASASPLRILLWLQFMLLCAFLAICVAAGSGVSANAPSMVVAGMFGVTAMAVQNALVRVALKGAPTTAVMTTNITLLTMDLGDILSGQHADRVAQARERAKHTWPAIAGFLLGCALGAWCAATFGLRALVLPVGFALLAFALGIGVSRGKSRPHHSERSDYHP